MTGNPHNIDLTPTGKQRRDAILSAALTVARRRRHRRHAVRAALAAAPVMLLAIGAFYIVTRHGQPRTPDGKPAERLVAFVEPPATRPDMSTPLIQVIGESSDRLPSLDRYRTHPPAQSMVATIDDDTLLRELDAAGLSAGLATVGTTTTLVVNEPTSPSDAVDVDVDDAAP